MRTANSARRARAKPAARKAAAPLKLTVQYATRSRTVPTDRQIAKWVRAALRAGAQVTVRIVGSTEGRDLNRTYRGKDYATNVLTFVMNDVAPDGRERGLAHRARQRYEGDLVLCAPIVAKEARAQRKDLTAHYAHLTVHGILHLQGYEHESESDAIEMEKLETRILKTLGYPDPYAALLPHGRHPQ